MNANVSHPVRFALALLAAGLLAANLASCAGSACGDNLDADLKADEPGDYVFEGLTHEPPRATPFLCSYSVRADAGGVLRASVTECEGRVGLHVDSSDRGDQVSAWFYGGPAKVSWSLSWTHPAALSESPNQLSGTLDPDYEGEEGCSSASETIP